MVNSVINQVFYDRCDIVEVSTPKIDENSVKGCDYENEYRTGCFGVKPPEDKSEGNEEDKEV